MPTDPTTADPLSPSGHGLRLLGLALLAVALGWVGWSHNLERACQLDQWPHLARCVLSPEPSPAERVQLLRERLARDPGDADTLVALAAFSQLPGGVPGMDSAAVQEAANRFAPEHTLVLRLQANAALVARRWPQAIAPLIKLSQFHGDTEATRLLARLVHQGPADSALQTALTDALGADDRWLDRVLRRMPSEKIPLIAAMPLVSEAMNRGRLAPATGQFLIRHLKAGGFWLDAYGVWLHLWNQPLGLLFNGDFEQAFIPDGFDWEPLDTQTHRAGARVQLSGRGERGQVLQVVFGGRAMPPGVLRQHLLLAPGDYRFTGDFQSSDLRSSEGLAWVFTCASDQRELARTPAIKAEGRAWRSFSIGLSVPRDCGLGVALTLQPQAAYEARTGMRGDVLFDRFKLEQAAP